MIINDLLSNKLNPVFKGEIIKPNIIEEQEDTILNDITTDMSNIGLGLAFIVNTFLYFMKSVAYGLGISTIFSMEWAFIPLLAVGFSVETILSEIFSIIHKQLNK